MHNKYIKKSILLPKNTLKVITTGLRIFKRRRRNTSDTNYLVGTLKYNYINQIRRLTLIRI